MLTFPRAVISMTARQGLDCSWRNSPLNLYVFYLPFGLLVKHEVFCFYLRLSSLLLPCLNRSSIYTQRPSGQAVVTGIIRFPRWDSLSLSRKGFITIWIIFVPTLLLPDARITAYRPHTDGIPTSIRRHTDRVYTSHRPHNDRLLTGQRSWDEAFSKSKDTSASLVKERETRLKNALQELDNTRKELKGARDDAAGAAAALEEEKEALSLSKARTNELHKLGVDMERELTAMLEGD